MKLIILAGGGGKRLFPLSRTCYPKQFLKIAGAQSLLQQTIARFRALISLDDILIVTHKDYFYHVQADLQEIGADSVQVITEPESKNTAPAIALALSYLRNKDCADDEVVFISPADHLIRDVDKFQIYLKKAVVCCSDARCIVTLGIKPSKPETGYGYIYAEMGNSAGACRVLEFKEKPDTITAKRYIDNGSYYWNTGMYVFPIKTMEEEFAKYAPKIAEVSKQGFKNCQKNFGEMPNISIDYAVAEKSKRLMILPLPDICWSDIGSFDAIADVLADDTGNAIIGDVIIENCSNNMILGGGRLISAVGIKNLMIVDTPDVLLVAEKGCSQDVRKIVNRLEQTQRKEIKENLTMHRPWGSYTVLAEGKGYKVKQITVKPGAKLSLQMHKHRSEHWTIISGLGKVTLDDKEIIFKTNESTYIPIGVKHRLENPGNLPLSIIEVQNGQYLGEDDIVRFDDIYGREGN